MRAYKIFFFLLSTLPILVFGQIIQVCRMPLSILSSNFPKTIAGYSTDNLYHVCMQLVDNNGKVKESVSYASGDKTLQELKDMFLLKDGASELDFDLSSQRNKATDCVQLIKNATDSQWQNLVKIYRTHDSRPYNFHRHNCVHVAKEVTAVLGAEWPWPDINKIGIVPTTFYCAFAYGTRAKQSISPYTKTIVTTCAVGLAGYCIMQNQDSIKQFYNDYVG